MSKLDIPYCKECKYWKANNAEEGDWSGKCTWKYSISYGQTTDGFDSCSQGVSGEWAEPYDEE